VTYAYAAVYEGSHPLAFVVVVVVVVLVVVVVVCTYRSDILDRTRRFIEAAIPLTFILVVIVVVVIVVVVVAAAVVCTYLSRIS